MIGVELTAVDTWFFRDGTAFFAGETPHGAVGGLFPPHPSTVVGALRAAVALTNGWDGQGRWPTEFCSVLGDGPDDLGQLRFDAPILLKDGGPLFPAPRHLLGVNEPEGWVPASFLFPGPAVTCDLGEAVRLPQAAPFSGDPHDLKPGNSQWLALQGMMAALNGSLPSLQDVIFSGDLWATEDRTGLELDRETGTAVEGRLYTVRQVRPADGVALGARIHGLPDDWLPPIDQVHPLGGESRLAECQEWDGELRIGAPAGITTCREVAIVALTPLDVGEATVMGAHPIDELAGARVVSAAMDRPLRIGGWDSFSRSPLPMRSVLPPGSVLFCEVNDPAQLQLPDTAEAGLVRLGQRQEWGFGLAALGAWPRSAEVQI